MVEYVGIEPTCWLLPGQDLTTSRTIYTPERSVNNNPRCSPQEPLSIVLLLPVIISMVGKERLELSRPLRALGSKPSVSTIPPLALDTVLDDQVLPQ